MSNPFGDLGVSGGGQPQAPPSSLSMTFDPNAEYVITAKHSGRVLDVANNGQGTIVYQWDRHNGANQRWKLIPLDRDGTEYRIQSVHSGLVMDVEGGNGGNGARVWQWPWHGGANQRFSIQNLGDGDFLIKAKHSGRALDISGGGTGNAAGLIQWDEHRNANQRFRIEKL